MLRELQNTEFCANTAEFKSANVGTLVTGMGVVRDENAKTFNIPTTQTVDVWVLDKERVPMGLKSAMTYISDYDDGFTTVKNGELAVLRRFGVGARFAVSADAFTLGTLAVNGAVFVGTDGKWAKATTASPYVYKGTYSDTFDNAGVRRTLYIIEKTDTNVTNS